MRIGLGLLAAALAFGTPAGAQYAEPGGQLFADFCAVCHGVDGRGQGVMAEVLTIAPADLTRLGAGEEFPTLRVVRRIDGRDPVLGHGGEMPIFGRWFEGDGPDVALAGPGGQPMLVSRAIADLVAYLREIQE